MSNMQRRLRNESLIEDYDKYQQEDEYITIYLEEPYGLFVDENSVEKFFDCDDILVLK